MVAAAERGQLWPLPVPAAQLPRPHTFFIPIPRLPRPPTIPFMETELVNEGTTSLGLCGRSPGTIEKPGEF